MRETLDKNCCSTRDITHFSLIIPRPAYYKLIEECVSQIVLHKSGCDPDFRGTRRFNIDVEPLIEQLIERNRADEERQSEGVKTELTEALTHKQETEAKLSQAQAHIAQLEEALRYATTLLKKLGTNYANSCCEYFLFFC